MTSGSQSGRGSVKLDGPPRPFNGVKVFSATMAPERENIGERITAWLRENSHIQVVDTIVTQSSDAAFHCLAFTLFYWEEPKA